MFLLRTLATLLCLGCGRVCMAIPTVELVNLEVEFGQSAILPCNGSAYREEEGRVHWEVMGEDVAILQRGELRQGNKFEGRVILPSEEKLSEGDWSVELQHTMLSDTDIYECIWQEGKAISTVWLTVTAPEVQRSVVVPEGAAVVLPCYIHVSRSQALDKLQVWWTKNGSTVVSTQHGAEFHADGERFDPLDDFHLKLSSEKNGLINLFLYQTKTTDNGEYHCFYKTKDSDDPRPGTPESISLTVLEARTTDTVMTESTPTEPFDETVTSFTHEDKVTHGGTTASPPGLIQIMTESTPMEPLDETVTSSAEEGTPETSTESPPWILIGLVAGVLLATVAVLCILGTLRKI